MFLGICVYNLHVPQLMIRMTSDYNTDNLKFSSSFHYRINDDTELMYELNYGTGTTIYQGDNRFSLRDIQFFQNIIELKKKWLSYFQY